MQLHTDPLTSAPWHRRMLDWLGLEFVEDDPAPRAIPVPERFDWEPVPPPVQPPQWGASNRPELLLGLDTEDDAARC